MTAIIWNILAIVIVMFPTNPGPTAETMNYTVVVGGGWITLCICYYYFPVYGGVHWFKGPMANVEQETPVEKLLESIPEKEDDGKYAG